MVIADLNVGVLYTFGIVSLGVYGIVLAGYAARSKYPFIGGIRSSAQMISYEIAMGMSVIPLFLIAGGLDVQQLSAGWQELLEGTSGLNLNRLVSWQAGNGWLIFYAPLSFVIFLAAMFAETNRMPFDMPESEQELAGGYNVEYSSMKFALFFMGEYANMTAARRLDGDAVLRRLDAAGGRFGPARRDDLGHAASDRHLPGEALLYLVHGDLGALDVAALPL